MTLREWLLFHNVMHRHYTRYKGRKVLKPPFDWIVLAEIIEDTRPDIIIEIGTYEGGTAIWMADLIDRLGLRCQIISIDIKSPAGGMSYPGVHFMNGNAADDRIIEQVTDVVAGRRGMVIEDSDHKEHITETLMERYARFVAPGCYMIVEDTLCEFTQTPPFPGPLGAIKRFVERHPEFVIDRSREKYVLTYNPMGYLLCTG